MCSSDLQEAGAQELVMADPGAGQPGVDDWDELEVALQIWDIAALPDEDDPVVVERQALQEYRVDNPEQHQGLDVQAHVRQSGAAVVPGHLSQKVADVGVQAQLDADTEVSIYFLFLFQLFIRII